MDKILIIDLAFLIVFCLVITLFLFKNKKSLKREGIIYLYRTKLGMNAINKFSEKYSHLLKRLKYIVIPVAFILMVLIISLLATNAYAYLKSPAEVIEATNGAPPIAPLIPYFPQIFGMESFFPNFYFSYFLIALAIVAVAHEFAHGIFMKTFGVKIKSTGFLFLGPILGAFVEEDKNNLEKKSSSEQMTILGAGVFANTLIAVFFFIFLILFFHVSHVPSGYVFAGYPGQVLNTSTIESFENHSENLILIKSNNNSFFISQNVYEKLIQNKSLMENHLLKVLLDYPAARNELKGIIVDVDGEKIRDLESFQLEISKKSLGDIVSFKTIFEGKELLFEIPFEELSEELPGKFPGVLTMQIQRSGNIKSIIFSVLFFKNPSTHYVPRFNETATEYIYYLIWWIALINLFVALFNMLPLGILDGGRFSYLLVLSIVKSEKKSKKIYSWIMSTIGLIFLIIIFAWIFARFF